MRNNLEAIDLFCGVGGLSYGLSKSGITIKAGLDSDNTCKYAYERNIKAKFVEADITNYDLSQLHQYYSENSIRILVGCPPCQPFSSHSYKQRNKTKDTRWNLIDYFVDAIKELEPDIISIENVRGFVKQDIFKSFLKSLERLNYEYSYKVVFCPDYGIPQKRYRLILIGSKEGKIDIPRPTHSKNEYKTVADTIEYLPQLQAGGADTKDPLHCARGLSETNLKRIRQSKQGGTWHDWDQTLLPKCYQKKSGQTFTSVYGRMSWEKPSPTITTKFCYYGTGRFGHPEQDRALSLREGALLQTFPKNYDFGQNSIETIGRHIGNSVPPRLGEVIGKEIKRELFDVKKAKYKPSSG